MLEQVLIVDDDSAAALSLVRALKGALPEARFHASSDIDQAHSLCKEQHPQVCILDLSLNASQGVEAGFSLLSEILALDSSVRIIVLTGHSSVEHGVRAISSGAASFIEKPANIDHLAALVRDGIRQSELRRAYIELRSQSSNHLSEVLCGSSPAIEKLRQEVQYAAQTNQAVLILGETGSGKGVCARLIHDLSRRSHRPFVRWQPRFSTSDLVNSELFGHAKGAFTGALAGRTGLLAEAATGTLFLDEIEELPLETQITLLGVLQDKTFRAVGSNIEQGADFRLLCASNELTSKLFNSEKLRRDFYHRVAHCIVSVPALRERLDDLETLSAALLKEIGRREQLPAMCIDKDCNSLLSSYSWPGNVRELEAVLEGAAFRAHFANRSRIEPADIRLQQTCPNLQSANFHEQVEEFKLQTIQTALAAHDGNQVRACAALGLDRSTMRRILLRRQSQAQ